MSQGSLHIIANRQGAQRCEPCLATGDTVVLLEDGVLLSVDGLWPKGVKAVVLRDDLISRNMATDKHETVDYTGFVDLCCQHQHCLSW